MARSPRILALDDSLTMRKLLEVAFKDSGAELSLAETGSQAIALVSKVQPDIVLMDYVLPDMSAHEICAAYAKDERTRHIPILITSAKGRSVLDEFRAYPSVVGFVAKPFKPAEIRAAVAHTLKSGGSPTVDAGPSCVAAAVTPRAAQRPDAAKGAAASERVARAAFTALQAGLARIPEWARDLQSGQRADVYFATKLFTPHVLQILVDQVIQAAGLAAASDKKLCGTTELVPALTVLRGLAQHERSGTLAFAADAQRVQVFLRQGKILAATIDDPAVWLADIDISSWKLTPELVREAEENQRKSGLPFAMTCAQRSVLGVEPLARALKAGTHGTLRRLNEGAWRFEWSDAAPPAWAEAHGVACAVDAIFLEGLRRKMPAGAAPDAWAGADLPTRCCGFSARALSLELDAEERTLLTLVNDRNPVAEIATRAGVEVHAAAQVFARLEAVGLIARVRAALPARKAETEAPRRVLLLARSGEPVFEHLRERWTQRSALRAMELCASLDDLCARAQREKPETLLVDGTQPGFDARTCIADLRARRELATAKVIAVIAACDGARRSELGALGYDAVLALPFLIDELEAHLSAA